MVSDPKQYQNTMYDPGLVYLDEQEKSKIERGVKWLLKKLGSNILTGQSVMTISLPVFLFDKRCLHEVFAYEHRGAPYYLTHALYSSDLFERFKWVITYAISTLFLSTFQTKPFNPIIGETFQAKIGDLNFYSEQTENHPITSNFYMVDDNNNYKIYGYIITTASTGPNSIYATKTGKYFVEFKDGSKYRIYLPSVTVNGLSIGKRLYNYSDKMLVVEERQANEEKKEAKESKKEDCKVAFIEMNPDKVGYFKSWFTTTQKTYPDTFVGKVVNLSNVKISEKEPKHTLVGNPTDFIGIQGQWTKDLMFDDEEYWNIDDNKLLTVFKQEYTLPSDGRLRPDLIALLNGDEELSQKEKETLEVNQRKDRKLRKDYKEKEAKK